MNLLASFKKVVIPSKTAAIYEFKQAAAGNDGAGNGDNKKKRKNKNGNGNLVKNSAQDEDFKMAASESWKDTFSKQFPHERPIWDRKIKMCARWHINSDCYDNCTQVASHVTNGKIPAEKKESFLAFMSKCCEAANKRN